MLVGDLLQSLDCHTHHARGQELLPLLVSLGRLCFASHGVTLFPCKVLEQGQSESVTRQETKTDVDIPSTDVLLSSWLECWVDTDLGLSYSLDKIQ